MKIEHGIPVPPISGRGQLTYPWPQMSPGDSILVPVAKAGKSGHRAVRSFADWRLRNGRRELALVCRTVDPSKVRIWLVTKEGKR